MDKKSLSKQLYFSKEAAAYLGITVQRLNKLIQEKKIIPLKKNSSGTVFHIDELNRRKEEQSIFTEIKQGGRSSMFAFDSKEKFEALNYSTLMNVLKCTEHRLEPLFDELGKEIKLYLPMDDRQVTGKYVDFFHVNETVLLKEYKKAYEAFLTLRENDEIIKRGNIDYPVLLTKTKQAPRFLYVRGKKSLLYEHRTVALVGSRQASQEAKNNTANLAVILGQNGITIISGLAKGIDVAAHKAALEKGYNTIAVIGTNLNQYYPSENKATQQEIEKKGLVLSQFSPASITQRWFFPLRNGVMSGLSLATVIMEAGETSGALKQADYALQQDRQVLIPASALRLKNITWPRKYEHKGAKVVNDSTEVLKYLAENKIFRPEFGRLGEQKSLYDFSEEPKQNKEKTDLEEWSKPVSL